MDKIFPSQHNFTTALVKIRLISNSIESGLNNVLDYIESETGRSLMSKEKMSILRQSVKIILECTETLEHISRHVTFPNKDAAS